MFWSYLLRGNDLGNAADIGRPFVPSAFSTVYAHLTLIRNEDACICFAALICKILY